MVALAVSELVMTGGGARMIMVKAALPVTAMQSEEPLIFGTPATVVTVPAKVTLRMVWFP